MISHNTRLPRSLALLNEYERRRLVTGARRPQDTVEFRDVGRGEYSGYAKIPQLILRLNGFSGGVTYSVNGRELAYMITEAARVSHFDRVLMGFIDSGTLIPLRMTDHRGRLRTAPGQFNSQVDVDAWTSGYVDIDDLLASDDLGLQSVLVHFIAERAATHNYARRIGTTTFTNAEFRRVHRAGIRAEENLLRAYFGDPTIRLIADSVNPHLRRLFKNSRRDRIRRLVVRGRGRDRNIGGMVIDVKRRDGTVMRADEYRAILARERAARRVAR